LRTNSRQYLDPISEADPTYLESLIREDFERCHPGETLEDLAARVLFKGGQRPAAGLDGGGVRAAAACEAKASLPRPTITSAVFAGPSPDVADSIEGSPPHRDPRSARRGAGVE
jgi:hypothetical protein